MFLYIILHLLLSFSLVMIVMQIHFFGVCGQLLSMTLSRSFHIAKWRWLPCFLLLFDGWPRWMSQIKCCGHSWSRLRANTRHRQFYHWTTFSAFQIKSLVRHACSTIFDVQLPCDDHSYILIAGLCVDSSIWFSSAHTTNETLDHNGVTAIWINVCYRFCSLLRPWLCLPSFVLATTIQ